MYPCGNGLLHYITKKKLKLARVVPTFKSGDPYSINHYIGISLLSSLSKIFGKLMYTHVVELMDINNIIYYKCQAGKHNYLMSRF